MVIDGTVAVVPGVVAISMFANSVMVVMVAVDVLIRFPKIDRQCQDLFPI